MEHDPPVRRTRTSGRGGRTPLETVEEYIARINAHDSQALERLGGPDVRFTDAVGKVYRLTREAWDGYFSDFPDYRIEVERYLVERGSVAVFGYAEGSFRGKGRSVSGASWHVPAAWRATVQGGKVVEWRVYCDVEPMLRSAGLGRFP